MKKIFSLVLVLTLVCSALMLTACGNSGGETTKSSEIKLKTLTLDDHTGNVITLEYPDTFKFDKDLTTGEYFGQNISTKCGTLVGKSYEIGFAFGSLYENAYSDFDSYTEQFKSHNIYEKVEVDGHSTYIVQGGDYYLQTLVELGKTDYFCMEVRQDNGTAASYKKIYDSKEYKNIFKSVKFGEADEAETVSSENGYISATPTTGWYEGEAKVNDSFTLYNDKISAVTWVTFTDAQLTTVEKQKEYILAGYKGHKFEEKTIGDNTYQLLEMDDLSYLVAESSTGKAVEIEVRNCTLDDAMELLKTVKIK